MYFQGPQRVTVVRPGSRPVAAMIEQEIAQRRCHKGSITLLLLTRTTACWIIKFDQLITHCVGKRDETYGLSGSSKFL